MKQASFLTKKHELDIWTDSAGDIWFYNQQRWRLIICAKGGAVLLSNDSMAALGPRSEFGPFTRLWKTRR